MRARIGARLRRWAYWLDPTGTPTDLVQSGYSFTFEHQVGITWRADGRGCPAYYRAVDYERAHAEADTEHSIVNWQNATAAFGRKRP